MPYELRSARYLAAECLRQVIQPGDTVIDATMGNGHDTAMLAELVGEDGHVIAFDVQPDAVAHTRAALEEQNLLNRCELHCIGHEHIPEIVTAPVRTATFNLGWLPGGNKTITTLWPTTKQAVEGCLKLLVPGGVLTICSYPGHAAGDVERHALTELLSSLRPQEFNVLHQHFLNAGAGAPECFIIQKQY